MQTLEDLFAAQLSDIHSAEKQLLEALPELAKASSDMELAEAFEIQAKETKIQAARLKRAFTTCEVAEEEEECAPVREIVKSCKDMMSAVERSPLRDAALIMAAQKAQHYEIAAYGAAVALADQFGYRQTARLLQQTLDEKKAADRKLSDIAEGGLNGMAEAA